MQKSLSKLRGYNTSRNVEPSTMRTLYTDVKGTWCPCICGIAGWTTCMDLCTNAGWPISKYHDSVSNVNRMTKI